MHAWTRTANRHARDLLRDPALRYGFLDTLFSAASSFVTIPMIVVFLTPSMQGYYYMFRGLLKIQGLLILGLGTVIQQFASHEWARLDGSADERRTAAARLAGLRRFAFGWYAGIAAATLVVLGGGGYLLVALSDPGASLGPDAWAPPWIAACAVASLHNLLVPALVFLYGANHVADVKRISFHAHIAYSAAKWLVLAMGGRLWLFAAGASAEAAATGAFLWRNHRVFLRRLLEFQGEQQIGWRKEILPMQWRIAASWIAGYVKYSLVIPLLFAAHGPVIAGRMGLTWTMLLMIQRMAGLPVTTRMPAWAMAGARNGRSDLARMFRLALARSLALAALGSLALLGVVVLCHELDLPVARRILPVGPTALLAAALLPETLRHAMVSLIWSQKKEPFWLMHIFEACLGLAILPYAGIRWGAGGLAFGFLTLSVAGTSLAARIAARVYRTEVGIACDPQKVGEHPLSPSSGGFAAPD